MVGDFYCGYRGKRWRSGKEESVRKGVTGFEIILLFGDIPATATF